MRFRLRQIRLDLFPLLINMRFHYCFHCVSTVGLDFFRFSLELLSGMQHLWISWRWPPVVFKINNQALGRRNHVNTGVYSRTNVQRCRGCGWGCAAVALVALVAPLRLPQVAILSIESGLRHFTPYICI